MTMLNDSFSFNPEYGTTHQKMAIPYNYFLLTHKDEIENSRINQFWSDLGLMSS